MVRLTGGQIIAEYLEKEEVPYIVGIPGHGNTALLDAFVGRDSFEFIQSRHEQSAAHIADGYFRISGKPLTVVTSIGPGATNTVTGVATAYVDSSAMLVITGAVHTYMAGVGVLQEIERKHWADNYSILKPVVKKCWQVSRVDQLPRILPQAFRTMLSGRPGPVNIDLPMDVQADVAEVEVPEPYSFSIHGGHMVEDDKIRDAAHLLIQAKRPLLLIGGGTTISRAEDKVIELAEYLGIPVVTTWGQAKGSIPEDHPLNAFYTGTFGSIVGTKLSLSSDVILAVGCRFADQTTSSYKTGSSFNIPPTKLIQIDIDPEEIGKNYPVEVGLSGDAKLTLESILHVIQSLTPRRTYTENEYYKEFQLLREEWMEELEKRSSHDLLTSHRVLKELRGLLRRDAIVISDAGWTQILVSQEFPAYMPRTQLGSGGFSTMGFGVPAAIGAKLASPERQVVAIEGDGSFIMTNEELATAIQHDIPIVVIILNNVGWVSIRDLQDLTFGPGRNIATEFKKKDGTLYSPNLALLSEAYGCHSERVEKLPDLRPALKRALDAGKPAVVEIMVDRKYPNTGAKGYGWWDVPVPYYLRNQL